MPKIDLKKQKTCNHTWGKWQNMFSTWGGDQGQARQCTNCKKWQWG